MKIEYHYSPPNHQTFKIKPIKKLLQKHINLNHQLVIDPFSNRNHGFSTYTNDLNPTSQTTHNLEASEFLSLFKPRSIDVILFDPPYSLRQLKECYNNVGLSLTQNDTQHYWSNLKNQMSNLLKSGGKIFSFGWSSVGLGKNRNFTKKEIHIICHGGNHNDTIITIEQKNPDLSQFMEVKQ